MGLIQVDNIHCERVGSKGMFLCCTEILKKICFPSTPPSPCQMLVNYIRGTEGMGVWRSGFRAGSHES